MQALVLRRDATMTAESYCFQSAEQLFAAQDPTEEEYWRGAGQPEILKRKTYVKRVIHQLFEVSRLHRKAGEELGAIVCAMFSCWRICMHAVT